MYVLLLQNIEDFIFIIFLEALSGFIQSPSNEATFHKVADNYIRHAPKRLALLNEIDTTYIP